MVARKDEPREKKNKCERAMFWYKHRRPKVRSPALEHLHLLTLAPPGVLAKFNAIQGASTHKKKCLTICTSQHTCFDTLLCVLVVIFAGGLTPISAIVRIVVALQILQLFVIFFPERFPGKPSLYQE